MSDRQPDERIDYMDAALYEAAARGNIGAFNNYQGLGLVSLRTPDNNTVLHVYLATPKLPWHLNLIEHVFLADQPSVARFLTQVLSRPLVHLETPELCSFPWHLILIEHVFANQPPVALRFLTRVWNRMWSTSFIEQILNKCSQLLVERNTKDQTPLHVAARYGSSTDVKILIEARARHRDGEQQQTQDEAVKSMLRMPDVESNTALHIAAKYGSRNVVQELLKFENSTFPDSNFPYSINRKQESLLYIAAWRGDGPLLKLILGKWESIPHGGPHGRTALHAAAMSGSAGAARKILEMRRELTNEGDEDGHTPLHYAAHLGHSSVVKVLLKSDISAAYATDKKLGMTPLLMAARQGHGHIVTMILSFCPDCCEKVDKIGWNLLHFVAFRNSPYLLSDPIFHHGDVSFQSGSIRSLINAKDVRGITPQHVYFAYHGDYKSKRKEQIVKLLEHMVNEEVAEVPVRPINPLHIDPNLLEKTREAHFVVATLIATVTFAAAIAVPGGFKSDKGSEQGTPFLIHDTSFKAFVVVDALAFILSLSAIFVHFDSLPPFILHVHRPPPSSSLPLATGLLVYAMFAIMVAFATGTYAVLKPSPWLATTSCCIGLSGYFFLALKAMYHR